MSKQENCKVTGIISIPEMQTLGPYLMESKQFSMRRIRSYAKELTTKYNKL